MKAGDVHPLSIQCSAANKRKAPVGTRGNLLKHRSEVVEYIGASRSIRLKHLLEPLNKEAGEPSKVLHRT